MNNDILENILQEFSKVNGRLDKIDNRLDKVDERLDKMDERLDKMDERFDKLESRQEVFDVKLNRLIDKVDDLSVHLTVFEHNTKRDIRTLKDADETIMVLLGKHNMVSEKK